jgi:hypothetical protein
MMSGSSEFRIGRWALGVRRLLLNARAALCAFGSSWRCFGRLLVVFFCLILLWHNPSCFGTTTMNCYSARVRRYGAQLVGRPVANPKPLFVGLRRSRGEFQCGVFSVFVNAVIVAVWQFPATFSQQAAAVSIAHLVAPGSGRVFLARDRGFRSLVNLCR